MQVKYFREIQLILRYRQFFFVKCNLFCPAGENFRKLQLILRRRRNVLYITADWDCELIWWALLCKEDPGRNSVLASS